ncbi:unnamed protein product, partial [Mesorhabditis belari]|uniref:Uncharacterized protein n=1 Tax=Mesorhabditis belari TaxID=2138241 RepID=A0AAF3F331_9BILA
MQLLFVLVCAFGIIAADDGETMKLRIIEANDDIHFELTGTGDQEFIDFFFMHVTWIIAQHLPLTCYSKPVEQILVQNEEEMAHCLRNKDNFMHGDSWIVFGENPYPAEDLWRGVFGPLKAGQQPQMSVECFGRIHENTLTWHSFSKDQWCVGNRELVDYLADQKVESEYQTPNLPAC